MYDEIPDMVVAIISSDKYDLQILKYIAEFHFGDKKIYTKNFKTN